MHPSQLELPPWARWRLVRVGVFMVGLTAAIGPVVGAAASGSAGLQPGIAKLKSARAETSLND